MGIYNVYVTTSEYTGATGQCTQGKLRRRLDSSDGVEFPPDDEAKVSKKQAEEACAHLTEQKQNCVTDIRLVDEPDIIEKITEDFGTVETTVEKLKVTTTTTTTTAATEIVDASTATHLCFSVLAMLIVSIL